MEKRGGITTLNQAFHKKVHPKAMALIHKNLRIMPLQRIILLEIPKRTLWIDAHNPVMAASTPLFPLQDQSLNTILRYLNPAFAAFIFLHISCLMKRFA
jgi:hypothetical protein